MFDLAITNLSKTENEEGYIDFIALTDEQWEKARNYIEKLKGESKITECPMCMDCPDNCPLDKEKKDEGNN